MDHQRDDAHAAAHPLVVQAGFFMVTLSCVLAVYRAAGDAASIAFVLTSYGTLLLLFASLRAYERTPPGEPGGGRRRDRIRRLVWALSTLLTVLFAWRVAGVMMPYWPAALLVWALAAATAIGGFVALFHRHP
ncbi:unnamed protein product [Urochloa decumbens]|uniref:Uncharacterized protein n=1 Tax=Urochloa decumbens TaxID=240449 RepID=A0ABC9DD45_9POAL